MPRIDDRGVSRSASAQIIEDPLVSIGTAQSGFPKYIYYQLPAIKKVITEKVLWSSPEEYTSVFNNTLKTLTKQTGTVVTSVSLSGEMIIIGGQTYWPGTIETTHFPSLGSYDTSFVDETITHRVTVNGFTYDGTPIFSGDNLGTIVSRKSIVSIGSSSNTSAQALRKVTYSNFREINGTLYADKNEEIINT